MLKIALVVASGIHQGKSIPVPAGTLMIGRDPKCHLRPASPAVSKLHCTIVVREDKVFVTDHGSTNGTFLEEVQIEGEVEAKLGQRLRVGPLDFVIQEAAPSPASDSTPLPDALKSVDAEAGKLSGQSQKSTPEPQETKTDKPAPPKLSSADSGADEIAAMLLADDEESGSSPEIPGGSTVMEIPSVDAEQGKTGDDNSKADKKNKIASEAETSEAADSILRKYFNRPR